MFVGDIPTWMFEKKSNQEENKKSTLRKRDSKKPAQPLENDNHARQKMKVKEIPTEEKFVTGPVMTKAQAKKSDKVHPLKVKG